MPRKRAPRKAAEKTAAVHSSSLHHAFTSHAFAAFRRHLLASVAPEVFTRFRSTCTVFHRESIGFREEEDIKTQYILSTVLRLPPATVGGILSSHRAGEGCFVLWGDDQEVEHPFALTDLLTRMINLSAIAENPDMLEGTSAHPHSYLGICHSPTAENGTITHACTPD